MIMTREQLWQAYEQAWEAREAHAEASQECQACSVVGAVCETWRALVTAWRAARQAWVDAPGAGGELYLWRVSDCKATYGDTETALIATTSAQEAQRWFIASYEPASWWRRVRGPAALEVTLIEWPPPEGVLMSSDIDG